MSIQMPSCLTFYNICKDNLIQIAIEIDKLNERLEVEEQGEYKEMKGREKIEVDVERGIGIGMKIMVIIEIILLLIQIEKAEHIMVVAFGE